MNDYLKESARTVPQGWHGDLTSLMFFSVTLGNAIDALQKLDYLKKLMFYGKGHQKDAVISISCKDIPRTSAFKNEQFAIDLIHAILGIATEAGELLEALQIVLSEGKPVDEVSLKEEGGDLFWYIALLTRTLGTSFEEMQQMNIAKLLSRYPEDFTEEAAINRNVNKERQILEPFDVLEAVHKRKL
jgi:NTP pyrophosphatase (non-canonical NTP hydrolase)